MDGKQVYIYLHNNNNLVEGHEPPNWPPPKRYLAVADVFVPSFAATTETTFGGGLPVPQFGHC